MGWDPDDSKDEQARQLDAWQTIQRGHAIANGVPVVSVNRVGLEPGPEGHRPGALFWGNSFVAGCQGEILAQAGDKKEEVLVIDLDRQRSEDARRIWPFLRDRRIDSYGDLTRRYRD